MNKMIRERKTLILSMGLNLQRIERRSKHVAFICAEGVLISATTPSDQRELRNFRSVARRLTRY